MHLKFVAIWASVLVLGLAVAAVVLIVPALQQRGQTGNHSGPRDGGGGACTSCEP
jgi:hypothetical protein